MADTKPDTAKQINYVNYESEIQMPDIVELIKKDLSEPYSVYTYRYFINNWSKLCFLAYDGTECVGAIVCKLDLRDKNDQPQFKDDQTLFNNDLPRSIGDQPQSSKNQSQSSNDNTQSGDDQRRSDNNGDIQTPQPSYKGYIAMLVVKKDYRNMRIGSTLVTKAIEAMKQLNADEVVLETEVTNRPALKLYENLGFLRDKRLFRYYLNGLDALRLKLWLV